MPANAPGIIHGLVLIQPLVVVGHIASFRGSLGGSKLIAPGAVDGEKFGFWMAARAIRAHVVGRGVVVLVVKAAGVVEMASRTADYGLSRSSAGQNASLEPLIWQGQGVGALVAEASIQRLA